MMRKILMCAVAACFISTGALAASNVLDDYGGNINYAPSGNDEKYKDDIVQHYNQQETGAPVKLSADKAEYNDETGDFYASGNVVLTQNGQTLKTTYAEGNMKNGQVFLKQGGEFLENGLEMHGGWIYYNFLSKTGEIQKIEGQNYTEQEWYTAPDATIKDGKLYAEHGATMSYCPAKKHPPCMSVEAKYFEIIPHKRMMAKDCWIKVRGAKLFHRDRWINDFKKRNTRISPKAGFEDDKGGFIGLEYERPLWNRANVFAWGKYYTHDDWKYWYEVSQDMDDFDVTYGNGWYEDGDDWYYKKNNLKVKLKNHRIWKGLPLSYSAYYERGNWKRRYRNPVRYSVSSWHKEYGAYLYHDPIHFFNSKKNYLNLYIGKTWTEEEVGDSKTSSNVYGATFTQEFGKNVKVWVGYYDQKYYDYKLFDVGQPDMAKELRPGIQYTTPNQKNIFSWVYRLNVKDGVYNGYRYGHRYGWTLNWKHHFCCWDLEVVYERCYAEQKHSLKVFYYFNFF